MTVVRLPLRVDIRSGERLTPTGTDPRALPWVQGAAETQTRRTRQEYAAQLADLRERLSVLRSRRVQREAAHLTPAEIAPAYGPRRRPWVFKQLPLLVTQPDGE